MVINYKVDFIKLVLQEVVYAGQYESPWFQFLCNTE